MSRDQQRETRRKFLRNMAAVTTVGALAGFASSGNDRRYSDLADHENAWPKIYSEPRGPHPAVQQITRNLLEQMRAPKGAST